MNDSIWKRIIIFLRIFWIIVFLPALMVSWPLMFEIAYGKSASFAESLALLAPMSFLATVLLSFIPSEKFKRVVILLPIINLIAVIIVVFEFFYRYR